MKKFFTNFNWGNWLLLIGFLIMMCVDLAKEDYISACGDCFITIFNMFLIIVLYQRRIMTDHDEQKKREEKIIELLRNKEE